LNIFDLTGKVAIITGSTKGIGLGIARLFARCGAKLAITSRNQLDCDRVASEINEEQECDAAFGLASDLADAASLKRLVEATASRFGGLDILVMNAANTTIQGRASQTSAADFQAMLNANVVNNTELVLAAHSHLLARRGGSVILIGSIAGTGPSATTSAYSICKRALLQLADNLAIEWGRQNIRVNVVAPGVTKSEDTRFLWDNPQVKAAIEQRIPLGRFGEPEDIAAACLWLASPLGAYVTGQTIVIDGGMTMRGASDPPVEFKEMRDEPA
jgi:NAD(P)-dependent dehydrogenase (short-subunit alcohol dehydrogenase family)